MFKYSFFKVRQSATLFYSLIAQMIALVVSSCNGTIDSNVLIDPYRTDSLSTMLVSADYIPLETKQECMMSEVVNIKKYDSKYFISDDQYVLYIFSEDGKYLSKINHRGRGHGEYLNFVDYDFYDGKLYILSRSNKAVFVYELNGDYVKTVDLGDWYTRLLILDREQMLLYADNSNDELYNYVIYNYNSNEIVLKYDPFVSNFSYTFSGINNINKCGKDVFLIKPFDYSLYTITLDGFVPYLTVDFNSKDRLDGDRTDIEKMATTTKGKRVVRYINSVTKVGNIMYIYYTYSDNGFSIEMFLASVNLKNGEVKNVNLNQSRNNEIPILGDHFILNENEMYSISSAHSVKYLVGYYNLKNEILERVDESDNPVLVVSHLH